MPIQVKQIFIVDDDSSICKALGILLGTYGLNVKTFADAEAFFKQVSDEATGCLILDLHLPGMDGWSVQKRLRAAGSKLQIIIISSDKNEVSLDRAMRLGVLGYLQKPFHNKELMNLINLAFKAKPKKELK